MSYAVSKGFVKWYTSSQAERFNTRGLGDRLGVPGVGGHRDGEGLEADAGAGAMVADFSPCPAGAEAEEMAELFAFCFSDRAGYLTGTDILNDGGVVASMRERVRVAAFA